MKKADVEASCLPQIICSALRFFASFSIWRRVNGLELGAIFRRRLPKRLTRMALSGAAEKRRSWSSNRALLPIAALIDLGQRARTGIGPINGRAEIRFVKYSDGIDQLLRGLHDRRGADREVGLPFTHRCEILLERSAVLHVHALRFRATAQIVRSLHAVCGQAVPT